MRFAVQNLVPSILIWAFTNISGHGYAKAKEYRSRQDALLEWYTWNPIIPGLLLDVEMIPPYWHEDLDARLEEKP